MAHADNDVIIDKNIVTTQNDEYYLYGYYINNEIRLNNFSYDDIAMPSIPMQAIKAQVHPQQMFAYGFEITAKDLNEKDFETYWNARLKLPIFTTDDAKKHLYEYRVIKGDLAEYKKSSFAYSLYLKTNNEIKLRIYIPKNVYATFKFKNLRPYIGKEIYAIAQIEKWDDIVMQIHHPNQIIYKEDNTIFRLFEKKELGL
ncbi:MAG: hypothetical protein ACK5LE_07555 [Alphaproteobacteria bacterium]